MAGEGGELRFRSDMGGCFLCTPEPEWTWLESEHFRAILGVGPIGTGFTLIAAREHVPSMLDLPPAAARELQSFTAAVRQRLEPLFGPSSIGEHGRVSPCVGPSVRRHEPHCLHAHRLVFPGRPVMTLTGTLRGLRPAVYDGFAQIRTDFAHPGQYVYIEDSTGRCEVAPVGGPLPRQFLRAVAASYAGAPELADWRSHPGLDQLEKARRRLTRAAS